MKRRKKLVTVEVEMFSESAQSKSRQTLSKKVFVAETTIKSIYRFLLLGYVDNLSVQCCRLVSKSNGSVWVDLKHQKQLGLNEIHNG